MLSLLCFKNTGCVSTFKIWDPLCIVRVPNWPTPLIIVIYQLHKGISIKAIRSHSFEFHHVEKDKNGNWTKNLLCHDLKTTIHDQNICWLINLRSMHFEAELTMKMKTRKEKVLTWDLGSIKILPNKNSQLLFKNKIIKRMWKIPFWAYCQFGSHILVIINLVNVIFNLNEG